MGSVFVGLKWWSGLTVGALPYQSYLHVGEMRHGQMRWHMVWLNGQSSLVPMAPVLHVAIFDVGFAQHIVQALRGVM